MEPVVPSGSRVQVGCLTRTPHSSMVYEPISGLMISLGKGVSRSSQQDAPQSHLLIPLNVMGTRPSHLSYNQRQWPEFST